MDSALADQVVVVVPTIREASIKQFLAAWQFPCPVIIVEDNPEPTFDIGDVYGYEATHYTWADIERDLGVDSWIIPRRTDCIRSYGYWRAWQTGAQYIITLDDDCLPTENEGSQTAPCFIQEHLINLQPHTIDRWYSTIGGAYSRGYPYEQHESEIPVGISHGLWFGVPDFDSLAQLHHRRAGSPEIEYLNGIVPRGSYYPMCGMNLAWRRKYTPLLYFLLMGQDHQGNAYPFDRFGDIWAGIISKKILDYLEVGVWSGGPLVRHERASNVWVNFDKEHEGIKANERFWQAIDSIVITEQNPAWCYEQIADTLPRLIAGNYWKRLDKAMHIWSALYE